MFLSFLAQLNTECTTVRYRIGEILTLRSDCSGDLIGADLSIVVWSSKWILNVDIWKVRDKEQT